METQTYVRDLLSFLDKSPVNFFAAQTVTEYLDKAGFTHLNPSGNWVLEAGKGYYITKNSSAVMAFYMPSATTQPDGWHIISSHSDSPCLRIKPNPEIQVGGAIKLNVEVYGGPILYTWFDRPLSIAGRIMLRSDNPLQPKTKLVKWTRPLLTIPHLAIHFNRAVNDGNPISRQRDMMPVIALVSDTLQKDNLIVNLISEAAGCKPEDILDFDLSLYDTTPAMLLGLNNEFISSGRIDDLSMVHASLSALLATGPAKRHLNVMAVFDNEETGSGTKQGAASPILEHLLHRINHCNGSSAETFYRQVDNSFMISADNAHAFHPNYADKYDPTNHPVLGGGPVVKINANCKYMTDADGASVFKAVCEKAGVPCQMFVNHSDIAGGSTLGNILTSQLPLRGVDMGAGVWAMHSIRETASAADHEMTIKAFTTFYSL